MGATACALFVLGVVITQAATGASTASRWIVFSAHPNGVGDSQLFRIQTERRGPPADNEGQSAGDRSGVLTQWGSHRVLAAGLRTLHRETGRERPAQAHLRHPRQLPRLVAGRQAHRIRPAVQDRLAPQRHDRVRVQAAAAAPGAARRPADVDRGRQSDPHPGLGGSRQGRCPVREGSEVLRTDTRPSVFPDRDAVAQSPEDRIRRAAPTARAPTTAGRARALSAASIWPTSRSRIAPSASSTTPVLRAGPRTERAWSSSPAGR